jgi:acetolactate decarboxylase
VGRFDSLQLRAACPARPGEGLAEATKHQSEFSVNDLVGTLVGFWAPEYAHTVGIPGYHFHFISDDRQTGGHVLDLTASRLEVEVQTESSIHLAMPDTAEFRSADLSGDHRDEIDEAETGSRS